jgi:hypothetical protein
VPPGRRPDADDDDGDLRESRGDRMYRQTSPRIAIEGIAGKNQSDRTRFRPKNTLLS